MKAPLSAFNALLLLLLALLHFYWAMGGKWGFDAVLPTNEKGERVMNPKIKDSILVAFGLSFFSIYYLMHGGWLAIALPPWLFNSGIWIISGLFLLRSIGDFKYVGMTKKVKNTAFASNDNRWFIPICLIIGLIGVIILTL